MQHPIFRARDDKYYGPDSEFASIAGHKSALATSVPPINKNFLTAINSSRANNTSSLLLKTIKFPKTLSK